MANNLYCCPASSLRQKANCQSFEGEISIRRSQPKIPFWYCKLDFDNINKNNSNTLRAATCAKITIGLFPERSWVFIVRRWLISSSLLWGAASASFSYQLFFLSLVINFPSNSVSCCECEKRSWGDSFTQPCFKYKISVNLFTLTIMEKN